jgi:O-antigen ligase
LFAAGGLLVWKLSRQHRVRTVLITLLVLMVFLVAMPGGYQERLATILHPETDQTTSAQERQKVLKNAAEVAARRFIVGVGMGNFLFYSIRDAKAHNSYLEILAELGIVGLVAYLIVMLRPLRSLRRIEAASAHDSAWPQRRESREFYCLSVGLQGAILSYMVCSFFLSLEYFWHVYYPVACAIALRQIHAVEANVPMAAPSPARSGVLWQSRLNARPRPTQTRSIYLLPGAGRN